MKRILSILCIAMALIASVPAAHAGGARGCWGGGWYGGGYYGGYAGCGAAWWPLVGLGIGFGLGAAAAHCYTYPAYTYSYAPASYAYVQPAYVYRSVATYNVSPPVRVAPAPAVRSVPPVSSRTYVNSPAPQGPQKASRPPSSTVAVASAATPRPVAIASSTISRGTWVQDSNPYIYPPELAPDRPSTISVNGQTAGGGKPARSTALQVVSR